MVETPKGEIYIFTTALFFELRVIGTKLLALLLAGTCSFYEWGSATLMRELFWLFCLASLIGRISGLFGSSVSLLALSTATAYY